MSEPRKYRKKPVVIEAMVFDGTVSGALAAKDWIATPVEVVPTNTHHVILIPTLEGKMQANPGDYIIRGVQGEFYPCKSDIFEATYERVDDDERTFDSVSEVRGDEAS